MGLFVEIVRSGSLAKAGKKLSIPANTLSRRLVGLERKLGIVLIIRSTKTLKCTVDGQRLFDSCSSHIDVINDKINSLQASCGNVAGKVKIQVPSGFFNCCAREFLGGY
ncbi:LysR family transcriptional regulator [Pseudomonas sp. PH1b]|uniref:LysR family transcriptional regulator n=1 Tax=Pseudomonas sp. PH1b TaxID=1397282 RepID=UPI003528AA1B